MKNSHVSMDRSNLTNGCKKFKRRVRDSVKREEKSIASVGPKLEEFFGKIGDKKLQPFDPSGEYLREPDILNTALNMKLYTLPTLTRNQTETPLWSISETPVKNRNDSASLQVSVFDNQQAITKNCSPQPRILLCKRPESPFCSTSRASYLQNSVDQTDLLRKRSEEQSAGEVTEIKEIQQTRRLLANARERTRVHTISAAFEALRKQAILDSPQCRGYLDVSVADYKDKFLYKKQLRRRFCQVPCYSYGQKLSKLAILRIACNYILSLAQLVDLDYTPDHSNMSFSECVEQCTKTLQAEGRSKKRKE